MSIEYVRSTADGGRAGVHRALAQLAVGATCCFALASSADAQAQTWFSQIGPNTIGQSTTVAANGAEGVFVGGGTGGSLAGMSAGGFDAYVASYDRNGNQNWIRQLGTSQNEQCSAVVSDDSGGVYACGFGNSPTWIARYDVAGNQIWIQRFHVYDTIWAAAPDGAGGLYVCGETFNLGGPSAGLFDAWVARIDGAGSVMWIRQFGSSGWDVAIAASTDGSGGVFLCGLTDAAFGGPHAGEDDVWLAHYDGAGTQSWIRQIGTPGVDLALAAAPDGSGGVYFAGRTEGSLGAPSAGGLDNWIARYDGAGNQSWITQFGGLGADGILGMTTDGGGGIFVTGYTTDGFSGLGTGYMGGWLAHFDQVGSPRWIQQTGSSGELGVAIAWSSSLGIFVGGSASGGYPWIGLYSTILTDHYCSPAPANSTGAPSEILATGSSAALANDVTLIARQLPANSFGYFLNAPSPGFVPSPGGSQGNLCLSGGVGRYSGPGQVLNSGASGSFALRIDLTQTPTPTGFVALGAGQSWNFQAWYRDANPAPTDNFSDAVRVTFY